MRLRSLALFLLTLSFFTNASEIQTNTLVPIQVGEITIFVPVNDAPVFSDGSILQLTGAEDTPFSYKVSVLDEDVNSLTWSVVNQASNGAFGLANDGTISYSPFANFVGNDTAIISVTDNEGLSDQITVNITITSVNDAPVISGTPVTEIPHDTLYSFTPVVTDSDSSTKQFSIKNKPSWASFSNQTGTLSGTPTKSQLGVYPSIEITVNDLAGGVASLPSFNIEVKEMTAQQMVSHPDAILLYEESDHTTPQMLTEGSVGDLGSYEEDNIVVGTIPAKQQVMPDGSFVYSIPIVTSGAVNGLKPEMALSYSSLAGEGVMGKGWSIAGASAIQRCGDVGHPVRFNEDDLFCLDGQKLVLVEGTHGRLDAEYRTELDSNLRITISDYSDGEPSEFRAEHMDGKVSIYGKLTAKISAVNANKTFRWALREVVDVYQNKLTFEYSQLENSLEVLLDRVNYTQNGSSGANSYIEFNYEPRTEAIAPKYFYGEKNTNFYRIENVKSFSDGFLLREYTPEYVDDFVQSIEVTNGTTSLAKTQFEWHRDPEQASSYGQRVYSDVLSEYDYKGSKLADVNGDGYVDIVAIKNSQDTHKDYLSVRKGSPDGFIKEDFDLGGFATDSFQMTWEVGDINGDNFADLIFMKDGTWHYHLSNEGSYSNSVSVNTNIPGDRDRNLIKLMDFNLDGTPDLMRLSSTSLDIFLGERYFADGLWQIRYSETKSTYDFEWHYPDSEIFEYSYLVHLDVQSDYHKNLQLVDLNGDGYQDLIVRVAEYRRQKSNSDVGLGEENTEPGNESQTVAYNYVNHVLFYDPQQNRFETKGEVEDGFIVSDFNNDGLADVLVSNNPDDETSYWKLRINQSSASELNWSNDIILGSLGVPRKDIRLVDDNRDGLVDVAFHDSPSVAASIAPGTSWQVRKLTFSNENYDFAFDAAQDIGINALFSTNSGFGDINGDGFLDYYLFEDGDIKVRYREDTFSNQIVKIIDGYGSETELVYGSLVDPSVHTRTDSKHLDTRDWVDSNPVTDIIYPMHVVKHYRTAEQNLEYFYHGGKNQHGRGPIGFESVTAVNHTMATKSEATYRQDFPFIGAPSHMAEYVLVSTTSTSCKKATNTNTSFGGESGILMTEPVCVDLDTATPKLLSSAANSYAYLENSGSYKAVTLESISQKYSPETDSLIATSTVAIVQPVPMIIENERIIDKKQSIDSYGRTLIKRTQVDDHVTSGAPSEILIETNTYDSLIDGETPTSFWGDRLVHTEVVRTRSGKPSTQRESAFHYDALGELTKSIKEPNSAEFAVITSVDSRDSYGNVDQQTTSIVNLDVTSVVDPYDTSSLISKTAYSTFDTSGRYVVSTTNEEGHVTTNSMNSFAKAFGYSDRVTDANGNYVEYDYSPLGRKYKQEDNLGGGSQITLQWCSGVQANVVIEHDSCPADVNAVYVKITETIGAPDSFEYYDEQGRVILTKAANSDGDVVNQVIVYDNKGRKERESVPFKDDATQFFTSYGYDLLNRVTTVTKPDGSVWITDYENFETTQTSPVTGRENKQVKDAHGRIISVTDTLPNSTEDYSEVTTEYDYDSVGNLVSVDGPMAEVDGHDDIIVTAFDSKGYFKTSMTDPDKGHWTYEHNAYGQLVEQTNANGQFVKTSYDKLGRTKTVIRYKQDESSQIASNVTYEYDTAELGTSGKDAIGLASVMDSVSNTGKSFQYDNLGRVDTTLHVIEGAVYTESTQYDSIGRAYRHTDVSGKTVQTYFNDQGFQYAIKDIDSGVVYWEAKASDQFGNVTEYTLHNNTISGTNGFDQQTGLAKSNRAGVNNSLVDIEYDWDTFGNLEYRENLIQNKTESFTYDDLNRLKSSTINGIDLINSYYKNGNIKTKGGTAGQYCYDMSRPHAVIGVSTDSCNDVESPTFERFVYDNNGNMTSGLDRSLEYSVSDMVTKITKGNSEVYFSYGPENTRYKRVDVENGETTTTLYVGNVEIVTKNGVETFKRTIGGVVQVNELFNDSGLSIQDYTYMFKDHLGSIVATTNHMGARVQQLSYDAWGQRRPADWSLPTQDDYLYRKLLASSNSLVLPLEFNRGYTGHEHIDSMGIIHMNGRIYDPVLGRFLQADPFVQFPYNTQNLNRYSYLMNNPLNATDPSGYFVEQLAKSAATAIVAAASNSPYVAAIMAAYSIYNAGQAVESFVQAYSVWQGGGGNTRDLYYAWVNMGAAVWGAMSSVNSLGEFNSDLKNVTLADASGSGELPEGSTRPLTDEEWLMVQEDIKINIEANEKTIEALSDPSSDRFAEIANDYGFEAKDFKDVSKSLIKNHKALIAKLNNVQRAHLVWFESGSINGVSLSGDRVGLSSVYFNNRTDPSIQFTLSHELAHKLPHFNHVYLGDDAFGNRDSKHSLKALAKKARTPLLPWDSEGKAMVANARGTLRYNIYLFTNSIRGSM